MAALFLAFLWARDKRGPSGVRLDRTGIATGMRGAWRSGPSKRAAALGARRERAGRTATEPVRRRPVDARGPVAGEPEGALPVPPDVARLVVARRLAPWRPGEDTVGYLFDPARRYFEEERLVSGRVPEAAEGLRSYRSGGFPMGVRDHVEGHVAARIRRLHAAAADLGVEAPWDFTLVINNQPCAGPVGCHRILRNILPQDSRLTVYVVRAADGRPELHDVYVGDGRAVVP